MSHEIEITAVTYTTDGVEEGDRRELASDETIIVMEDDDLESFETPVGWAVHVIDTTTDAVHPSGSPLPDEIPSYWWLSGTYTDPYDNSKETETSVRLTGDWTDRERAAVFTAITGKYHTA